MAVSYMTKDGYDKILAEINYLETVKRPEISAQIAEARDKGDLSENAEYDAAKEAQGIMEAKLAQLKGLISNARLIDESRVQTDEVQILNKVKIKNTKNNAVMTYTLVSDSEANLKDGKIAAVGETEELVKEVEGKVWNAVLDMAEAMTYETKVPVVNIYNREDGKTVLRYLAERPVISGSEPADARMEDLYLWMFPEQGKEEVR